MMPQRLNEGIQQNHLMTLLEFNYSIEYKKGQENRVADALSRKDQSISAISSTTPAWVVDIENSYINDSHYTDIIQQLLVNENSIQHYTVH
jgi:hypothetical protein